MTIDQEVRAWFEEYLPTKRLLVEFTDDYDRDQYIRAKAADLAAYLRESNVIGFREYDETLDRAAEVAEEPDHASFRPRKG